MQADCGSSEPKSRLLRTAARQAVHMGGNVDRDAADIAVELLAFTGGQARTDLPPEWWSGDRSR